MSAAWALGRGTCHHARRCAAGLPTTMPTLAGQRASRARAWFRAARLGRPKYDVAAARPNLSRHLTGDEIAAVAAYLEGARPGSGR